jgi:hypothetical protein
MSRISWKAWCLIALCLLLAAYSFALLYEGFISDRYSGVLTYPFVDKPAAERAYKRLPATASLAERSLAAKRLVDADPANPDSWNAVADSEFHRAGGVLSPRALEALDHSYALSFFDADGAGWRIGFALENWAALPASLRKEVLTEASVMLKDPALGPKLTARLTAVQNPAGRLAAAMMIEEAKADRHPGA